MRSINKLKNALMYLKRGGVIEPLHTIALRYIVRKKLPLGHCGKNSHIHTPSLLSEGSLENIYLGNNVNIDWNNVIFAVNAKFIMKDNSGAAVGLTVITGNHTINVGHRIQEDGNKNLVGKDVIVEENVWIAANVTLLAGTMIGRGATIGAGSVVRGKVPPYAIVMGNPAKVVGFNFTPHEIIEYEKKLFSETDRLPLEILEKNYSKYFLTRIKQIKDWTQL